ncbi:MAG: C-GCAxxG-C-C family protein [Anaerolineae bacterium]
MDTEKPQAEMHDRLAQRARDILLESGNCAQTSFAVLQEEFDLDAGEVLRALTPFPGIALRGETCGAVVGCLMALGLVYGRDDLKDWKGYIVSLPSSRRFCARFEEEHGSTSCANVLEVKLGRKYDLADRAQALEYASSGGPEACGDVVASAVEIAAELIKRKR